MQGQECFSNVFESNPSRLKIVRANLSVGAATHLLARYDR